MSEAAPPPASRRGRGTATDMVRTMAVIVAAVAALLLLVPRSPAIVQPGPDPVEAAGAAGAELGFDPLVSDVARLGEGWSVTFARVEQVEAVAQWHVGYLSPDGRRVDLEQSSAATADWLVRDETPDLAPDTPTVVGGSEDLAEVMSAREPSGEVDVGGVTWWEFVRGDGAQALARVEGDSVVVVSVRSARAVADRDRVVTAVQESAGPRDG